MLFIYIAIRITVDGLEEFLIMPTAWYYIKELGETTFFLGVTSYSIGVLVTAPFIGALDDRFHITKPILIISAACKFIGHLIYTIPINAYFPLCGRLLCGLANGSMGVLYAVVSRYIEKEGRAKAFLFFGGMFNFGIALAPILGSVIKFNFNILGSTIGKGNSPGPFLAIIWFLMIIATVFCIPRNAGRENSLPLTQIGPGARSEDKIDGELERNSRPIIDFKIACLYYLIFMGFFLYCVTTFYIPLLAADLYHLQLILVKLLFINGTMVVFVAFLSNYLAVEYVSERKLIIFWMTVQIFPILLLFYFDLTWHNPDQVIGTYLLLPLTMLGVSCFGYSIILALLSKVSPLQHAAFYLSLASTVANVSIICSRFMAGLTFGATSKMITLIGIYFLWVVQALWYYVQYENFICH